MGKSSTIDSYFKRKSTTENPSTSDVPTTSYALLVHEISPTSQIPPASETLTCKNHSTKFQRIKISEMDVTSLEIKALMNQSPDIQRALKSITSNRLLLKAAIHATRFYAFQGIDDERPDLSIGSTKRGDVFEMLTFLGSYNEQLRDAMSDIDPREASYCLSVIQKDICHCFATKVKKTIREEIGDAKFCLLVDVAYDVSEKEHMSLVLRFVDKGGFVQERFFGLVHVSDITTTVIKDGIYSVLSNYTLDIQNIRGQGYNAASNTRRVWNDLQTLISKDCQYAYYFHCFAHQLQLALIEASKEVFQVYRFFDKLSSIVTLVGASTKHSEEMKDAQVPYIAHLVSKDELMTRSGLEQIGSLQKEDDTYWSSHYNSVSSLINMFSATCQFLINIMDGESNFSQRGEASPIYNSLMSFEFIFILHLMKKILVITDFVSQTLQCQSQDILNAMKVVSSSKKFLQELRDEEWDSFLNSVKSFCDEYDIDVPNMAAQNMKVQFLDRGQEEFTVEHHYRMNIFYAVIDSQLRELNLLFNENSMELLMLSSSLDPQLGHFKIDDVCHLVHKFYPQDFNDQEKMKLEMEIEYYVSNVIQLVEYQNLSGISELCQWLVQSRRSTTYPLVFRVIVLVLTLPVFTATTERSLSTMSVLKNTFRSPMEDEFLSDSFVMKIERDIAEKFSTDVIIDDFQVMKEEFHFDYAYVEMY